MCFWFILYLIRQSHIFIFETSHWWENYENLSPNSTVHSLSSFEKIFTWTVYTQILVHYNLIIFREILINYRFKNVSEFIIIRYPFYRTSIGLFLKTTWGGVNSVASGVKDVIFYYFPYGLLHKKFSSCVNSSVLTRMPTINHVFWPRNSTVHKTVTLLRDLSRIQEWNLSTNPDTAITSMTRTLSKHQFVFT